MRTADSVREGDVMVFCFREAELNWRQELTYQRAETSWKAALASAPYTLTLWDSVPVPKSQRIRRPWRVRLIR